MPGSPNVKTIAVTSGATLVNEVIYPYPCIVHRVHIAHSGGAASWVQIHNSATVPAEGSVPIITHAVAAKNDATVEGGGGPFYFPDGVYICESTTIPTKTLAGDSHLFITLIIEERTTP